MLKRLFYASASILMLALAYHLGAIAAHAQSDSREQVTTRALILVDDLGKRRAVLSMVDGTPSLILNDRNGAPRAAFALREDGAPFIGLNDSSGTTRTTVQAGGLMIMDRDGRAVWRAPRPQVEALSH